MKISKLISAKLSQTNKSNNRKQTKKLGNKQTTERKDIYLKNQN